MINVEIFFEVIIQYLANEYYLATHSKLSIILGIWDILLRIVFLTMVK